MTFPQKPETEDERRTELLRLMGVPGRPRVYVLGSFARYVTIYAQQVRALNLLDSLAKSGVLSARSRLAVIGGGIAGITAAAAAVIRGVQTVTVFEKENDVLALQRTSEQRYVHPHIYDWPTEGALEDDAGLPVLNWRAERAAEVINRYFLPEWDRIRETAKVDVRANCGPLGLVDVAGGAGVDVGVNGVQGFDAVIIAAGFGRDAQQWTDSYWTDSRIDGPEAAAEGEWLVSGAGDGALTDLMRLCIAGFRHKQVLEAVDNEARIKVGRDLLDAESASLTPEQLAQRYHNAAQVIAPLLQGKLNPRPIKNIWLNCPEAELFSPRSSVLNRLITAWLLREGRFQILPAAGKIDRVEPTGGALLTVHFKDAAAQPITVRHVILRHGPRPDTRMSASFAEVYAACRDLERDWQEVRQHADWTKEPLFSPDDFDRAPERVRPLRVDFANDLGCIVVGRGEQQPRGMTLPKHAELALENFSKYARRRGTTVDRHPVRFSVHDVFRDSASYEHMVRALCQSPIAIFDITGYEPAVLLLLGVRAAVRRGITLTVSADDRRGGGLPFNIASLNPVGLGGADDDDDDNDSVEETAEALKAGFDAWRAQPTTYLDLPAYDAVRKLGEDHRPLEAEDQILVLRWFDRQYARLVRQLIEQRLKGIFESRKVVTILDSRSPQLTEQRLYAAIRRTRLCVADWTGWRPNVFFEIGVRLAVNETDPIFIACAEKPPGWNDKRGRWPGAAPATADLLKRFFRPTDFTLENDGELLARFQQFVNRHDTWRAGSALSPGRTYAVIKESIDRRAEPGGTPVHDVLRAEARTLAGTFGPEQGNSSPVLFAEALGEQASKAAVEHLLASWFYLNGRYRLAEKRDAGILTDPERALLDELEKTWASLTALFMTLQDQEYDEVRGQIAAAMARKG